MALEDVYSDLQRLLEPVTADTPAGRDLDGTLELNALETACLEPDDPGVAGVERVDERNWREIRDQAQALLEQSKHLRASVLLARALLQIEGLPGFCAGIDFVGSLAQRYWSELYPPLDPDDGDATMRINAIHELVSSPLLAQLRIARIATLDGIGAITLNDLLSAASSPLARADLSPCEPQIVFGVLDRLGLEAVRELTTLVQDTCRLLQDLTAFVSGHTGQYLQFGPLAAAKGERAGLLDAVAQALARQSERLAPPPSEADAAAAGGALAGAARSATGEIAHREDVLIMLDRICAYYARVEPSSPVPLLLQRAKRLASMDFLAIVRDLADQGFAQVATVAGIPLEEN